VEAVEEALDAEGLAFEEFEGLEERVAEA